MALLRILASHYHSASSGQNAAVLCVPTGQFLAPCLPAGRQAIKEVLPPAVQRREDETAVSAAGRMLIERESFSSSSSSL